MFDEVYCSGSLSNRVGPLFRPTCISGVCGANNVGLYSSATAFIMCMFKCYVLHWQLHSSWFFVNLWGFQLVSYCDFLSVSIVSSARAIHAFVKILFVSCVAFAPCCWLLMAFSVDANVCLCSQARDMIISLLICVMASDQKHFTTNYFCCCRVTVLLVLMYCH